MKNILQNLIFFIALNILFIRFDFPFFTLAAVKTNNLYVNEFCCNFPSYAHFQKNTIEFERYTCERNPNRSVSYVKCDVKHVSRRHLRFDMVANFTKPMKAADMHFMAYYKYTVWFKSMGRCMRMVEWI